MIYYTTVNIAENSERFEPQRFNIECTKGSDFLWLIYVEVPLTGIGWNATDDTTGFEARMHWRTTVDNASVVLNAHTDGTPAYMTLDETDPENLIIEIDVPSTATDDVVFSASTVTLGTSQAGFRRGGQGVYDVEVVLDSGRVFRILEGTVTTSDEVTR
jgi:hypothetical protein